MPSGGYGLNTKRLIDLPENMQAALEVADSASGLLCPECEGGDSHERSLSVARRGIFVVWRCWRDSCGWRGRAVVGGEYADAAGTRQTGFKPKPYMASLWQLSDVEARNIERRYGVYPETLARFGVRVNDHGNLYLPVRGPVGSERGGVLRPKAPHGPKAISYKTADEPWQAWYSELRLQLDPIVIVEDQLSAMRLWQLGFRAVALLGTNLSPDKLDEIAEYTVKNYAVLALDNDAFDTAIGYVREYASQLHLVPVLLQKDLKDSTDEEILKVLGVTVT